MNRPTWIEPAAIRINRLRGYEVVDTATSTLIERVKYDYYLDGHAAGNVAQIRHLTRTGETNDGTTTVTTYDAKGTLFEYNKTGELWFAKQREWSETHRVVNASGFLTVAPIAKADVTTKDVVDFRGAGRKRWMVRHRETGWPYKPLYDSAVWTDYEGVSPLGDYTVTVTGQDPNIVATQTAGQFYALGFGQVDANGQVLYEHGDQIGSTRAMSDSAGTVQRTFVYTAFGEPVDDTGTFATRYQYAGKHGYESFSNFSSNFPFPYIHTGARWYNPETGRFLQRDPIGSRDQLNVYVYVRSNPSLTIDPTGMYGDSQWESYFKYRDSLTPKKRREMDKGAGIMLAASVGTVTGGVAAAVVVKKVVSTVLRRLNVGRVRIGLSADKGTVYCSLRIGKKHFDLFKMPTWMQKLYKK